MSHISLKDVSFVYPNGFTAVKSISLDIEEGEDVAIIGRNGAGKTTAAKLVNGLCKPSTGTAMVNGMDTREHTAARLARTVGYVFQNPDDQIFHSSVISEVGFGPKILKFDETVRKRNLEYALELTGLDGQRGTNPYDLSFSMRRFVAIASVVAMDTPVVIFDEPTAGQDHKGLRRLSRILDELRGRDKTIITITHDMEFVAENFSRVIVMSDKKIAVSGAPREIFWDLATLEDAGLEQPYISRLCRRLEIPGNIIRMDEAIDALIERQLRE